jgi:exo-beta-1,3-glucanase (GH17 family)
MTNLRCALMVTLALWSWIGCGPDSRPGDRACDFGDGNAVCYGPHRDGQRPGGPVPTAGQLREDLQLMLPHWSLTRIYGATGFAETYLQVIRDDALAMKVMLGVWILPEDSPENAEANRREVDTAIRLAKAYPDIVIAVSVGNETQVSWTAHLCSPETLIGHIRTVRAAVSVPVTTADDFNFWNKPESRAVAAEVDFITMHAHPLWNGLQLDEALHWLRHQLEEVRRLHPDRLVVVGETGWATAVHDEGEQAELIKGRAGEMEQAEFYRSVRAWTADTGTTVFFFEAFDENWKGGAHPNEVEKHWGLFGADRRPKATFAH